MCVYINKNRKLMKQTKREREKRAIIIYDDGI